MKKYIDCDGVILDTENGLFDEYYRLKEQNPELRKKVYLQSMDWTYWLYQAAIINDALYVLRSYDPSNVEILTKVHSLKEAMAKLEYFRDKRIKNNIIFVPDTAKKSQVVNADGSILVDDSVSNLTDWMEHDGFPVGFDVPNSEFLSISSLDEILNQESAVRLIKSRY